jgi:hypothetical protein
MTQLTELLARLQGQHGARDGLFAAAYSELNRLAHAPLRAQYGARYRLPVARIVSAGRACRRSRPANLIPRLGAQAPDAEQTVLAVHEALQVTERTVQRDWEKARRSSQPRCAEART